MIKQLNELRCKEAASQTLIFLQRHLETLIKEDPNLRLYYDFKILATGMSLYSHESHQDSLIRKIHEYTNKTDALHCRRSFIELCKEVFKPDSELRITSCDTNRTSETFFAEFEKVCESVIESFINMAKLYNNVNPLFMLFKDKNFSYLDNDEALFVIDLGLFTFERSMHITYHSRL